MRSSRSIVSREQGDNTPIMGKVQLKIPPWIASLLKAQGSDWLILEPEIGEGATLGGLLTELTSSDTDFRKVVFNPEAGTVSDQLVVILNDSLLPESDVTETRLNDGDSIILLPVYAGG